MGARYAVAAEQVSVEAARVPRLASPPSRVSGPDGAKPRTRTMRRRLEDRRPIGALPLLLTLAALPACVGPNSASGVGENSTQVAEPAPIEPATIELVPIELVPIEPAPPLAPVVDPAPAPPLEPAPSADTATLERVALLGASATGGFNLNAELGRPARMADFLEQALVTPPAALLDSSDETLFSSPLDKGASAIEAAIAFGPTTTLAVDLPFWFVHGPYFNDDARRAAFDWLLESLDADLGDLVLGSIPPMGPEVAQWMVPASLRARDETVVWANARLVEWADAREHVVLVPMAEFLADLRDAKDLTLRDETFDGDDVEEFLQDDGLHPTVMGTAALLLMVLDGLDEHTGGALAEQVLWDVEELAFAVEDAD